MQLTDEQRQRRRETYRAWVAKNRDRVRVISRRAKERAKSRDPEGWRKKQSARGKAYYAKNRDKQKLNNHRANLKRHYGMTVAEYNALLASQGGRCAICRREPFVSLHKRLYVDHNHCTGRIRGLLCYRCNASLGQFGDDATGVARVLEYLRAAGETPCAN